MGTAFEIIQIEIRIAFKIEKGKKIDFDSDSDFDSQEKPLNPTSAQARIDDLSRACPEVDKAFLEEHASRLTEEYFRRFSERELAEHARALFRLSPERPSKIIAVEQRDGAVSVTVLAFDYLAVFSLITGILAGLGFHILSGEVFTYERAERTRTPPKRGVPPDDTAPVQRRIVDHFTGTLDTHLSFRAWQELLQERILGIVRLLEAGDEPNRREARRRVSEMVGSRLSRVQEDTPPVLYPVQISVAQPGEVTRLRIVSQDTPAFLHALSQALSLNRVSIERVKIRTISGRVEDTLDLVDISGRPITDEDSLDRVKLSVLLTKQFTYFLPNAPDPLAALDRFEVLLDEILHLPLEGRWQDMLGDSHALRDLARLLGASDFLWEEFVRLQYESLLPMLRSRVRGTRFSEPAENLEQRLTEAIEEAPDSEAKARALNAFKDREIFRIDLDHILNPEVDFRGLSERLTRLAEAVLRAAAGIAFERLTRRYGRPLSVAGMETGFSLLGLGKLGGAALGYASDIEILLVYADNGKTSGGPPITNADFFSRLAREIARLIEAKQEGIFRVDLRLRPYGSAGPLGCSLESFCRYYAPGGPAHAMERLALVRMRAVAGDAELGARLERLRNEMIYAPSHIDLEQLHDVREKQFLDRAHQDGMNAKFSPGGLVDLEYGVQALQVMHGRSHPGLMTPLLHEALDVLVDARVLSPSEVDGLRAAYDFLRQLINGMRMLRGSARDLLLPGVRSDEYAHLARRMGYRRKGGLTAAQRLRLDVETHTAGVRAFVERHFGRSALPGPATCTVADLVLSEGISPETQRRMLSDAGFLEPDRAYVNLKTLAGKGFCRETFTRLSVLAFDMLLHCSDPDRALNNWERYTRVLPSPEAHYQNALAQPMRLEILLTLFSSSQFLADTLVRHPGFLDWVLLPEVLHGKRARTDIEAELRKETSGDHGVWLNRLRRQRRREILRIGARDICLKIPTQKVLEELSAVAEAFVQAALERIWLRLEGQGRLPVAHDDVRERFCILALGKLGGRELNYSSDIDLLGMAESGDPSGSSMVREAATRAMEGVRKDLSRHTEEGYAFRVDLRLRPFGRAGDLVPSYGALLDYYRQKASLWEIQAALKIRPVAGNLRLGYRFLEDLREVLLSPRSRKEVLASVARLRAEAVEQSGRRLGEGLDVKNGKGGIRDVEFTVQALQLIYAPRFPSLLEGNTLAALGALEEQGILSSRQAAELKEDYLYLRRVEHALQLLEDRQIHVVPNAPGPLLALGRQLHFGQETEAARFGETLRERLERVRKTTSGLLGGEVLPA